MDHDLDIRVEGLGKQYRLGSTLNLNRSFRETLMSLPGWLGNRTRQVVRARGTGGGDRQGGEAGSAERFWALSDVSFDVRRGEVVGIIGRNGAGKSTLLKILARVTQPTVGRAEIRGRVGALLEVGTGFHPELTGRENVYLNGAILGMKRAEIDRKFDEIVAFAEVDAFLDTPVKRYSSGMRVRLGFAVAAHLDTEILIVDEVLAVGDAEFTKKCVGKMGSVSQEGRTVLFISHNMGSVRNLCPRTLLLEQGRITKDGATPDVIAEYLGENQEGAHRREWDAKQGRVPGDRRVQLCSARMIDVGNGEAGSGSTQGVFPASTGAGIEVSYRMLEAGPTLVHLLLKNGEGTPIAFTGEFQGEGGRGEVKAPGDYRVICRVPPDLLSPGAYAVDLQLVSYDPYIVHCTETDALFFHVAEDMNPRGAWGNFGRSVWPAAAVRPKFEFEIFREGQRVG